MCKLSSSALHFLVQICFQTHIYSFSPATAVAEATCRDSFFLHSAESISAITGVEVVS